MRIRSLISVFMSMLPAVLLAQTLPPSMLARAATDAWPTYHGDYSGRHYSTLDQINRSNVGNLTLAWMFRTNPSTDGATIGGAKEGDPSFWGTQPATYRIASMPLVVDNVMYVSADERVWAINAITGKQLWEYLRIEGNYFFGSVSQSPFTSVSNLVNGNVGNLTAAAPAAANPVSINTSWEMMLNPRESRCGASTFS